jgi:hypothetical protein
MMSQLAWRPATVHDHPVGAVVRRDQLADIAGESSDEDHRRPRPTTGVEA